MGKGLVGQAVGSAWLIGNHQENQARKDLSNRRYCVYWQGYVPQEEPCESFL